MTAERGLVMQCAQVECEYLGGLDGYHHYRGWRRQDGRLICCGYRAESTLGEPCDGEDVWFDTADDLRDALKSLKETPQ